MQKVKRLPNLVKYINNLSIGDQHFMSSHVYYLCVKGIDVAAFYDFDIWFWNSFLWLLCYTQWRIYKSLTPLTFMVPLSLFRSIFAYD